ncbi:ankyrin [Aspergillus indologenus CBS 114.80]|uniref:Ankyrin n=1 Tax=Aspergillus indologenus CBS 114.80 TaxID=1450541 RepID=A0A2V5I8B4_9EURO|nr:ankyrin [Aspergillus indologenus CBS 114.80]
MTSHDQNCDIRQLQEAALSGYVDRVRAILLEWRETLGDDKVFAENTVPILDEAIERDLAEVVETLLTYQVPMNAELFLKATRNTSYRILQAFLHHGWDINTPVSPYTPPALASSFHDRDLTKWFLDHGANPNQRCNAYRDCTPLSIAFREAEPPTIKLLLDYGASLQHGQVLHYAAMRELDDRLDVLKYLLQEGLPVNDIMYQNCGDEYYFNMYSGIGTPLHYAAARGLLDSARLLIENGASPLVKDPAGKVALEWAEYNGQTNVAEFLRPRSTGHGPETIPQFTAEDGRHFGNVSMEDFLRESGYQLV